MDGRRYSIGELAELTGVSRRTVHFYVQRRLIDPPLGRGRGRHYDERHARQILEVRALQGMGVPLADMERAQRAPALGGDGSASTVQPAAAPAATSAAATTARPGPGAAVLPSVTPSIMSVMRVRLAENVTLELSPGGPAITPALVAELTEAVTGALKAHASAGASARGAAAAGAQEGGIAGDGGPGQGAAGDGGQTHTEEDPEEES